MSNLKTIPELFTEVKAEFDSCGKTVQSAPADLEAKLEAAFEERKNRILNSESEWTLGEGGFVRYISSTDGDDKNDGLTPETAWKTVDRLHAAQEDKTVRAGDVVLFRRGDEWHAKLKAAQGITYSAYGEGAKPRLLASTEADLPEQWQPTDTAGVYKFTETFTPQFDVGNIVFNDGECYAMRVIKSPFENITVPAGSDNLVSNGINKWLFPPREFESYKDLARIAADIPEADLMYYLDRPTGELFLFSRDGNPAERFSSVELCTKGHGVTAKSGVTIDNLCIKYTGSHGIGSSTCTNLTVRNCEIGFIGGSFQFFKDITKLTRYGNAVEIYGGADGYYIYNNYIYQCFDCGPTVQWSGSLPEGKTVIEKDVHIHGNALREAALEVWLTTKEPPTATEYAKLINCRLYDNFVTGSGTGWKAYNHQKFEWCAFYGGGQTNADYIDCYIEDNCFWGERRHIMKAVPTTTVNGNGFNWRNNIIIHPLNEGSIGFLGEDSANGKGANKQFWYSEKTIEKLVANGTFGKNYFYYDRIGDNKNRRKFILNNVKLFDED